MSKPLFTEAAWMEYVFWATQDKKTFRKINELIRDIMRNGELEGLGKPERLKGELQGYYSRRINEKDQLVYKLQGEDILEILSCLGHYDE